MLTFFRYNVETTPYKNLFNLNVKQDYVKSGPRRPNLRRPDPRRPDPRSGSKYFINVCASYNGSNEKTNMVVIEVELPSGFQLKKTTLDELNVKMGPVKLVEYKDKTNSVIMYFNDMPKEEICSRFQIHEAVVVKDRQKSIAKIYDYYDQTAVSSVVY